MEEKTESKGEIVEKKVFIKGSLAVETVTEKGKLVAVSFRDRVPSGVYRNPDSSGSFAFIGRDKTTFSIEGIRFSFKRDEKRDVDIESLKWRQCGELAPRGDRQISGKASQHDTDFEREYNDGSVGLGASGESRRTNENGFTHDSRIELNSGGVEDAKRGDDGSERRPGYTRAQNGSVSGRDAGDKGKDFRVVERRGRGRGRTNKRTPRGRGNPDTRNLKRGDNESDQR